MVLEFDSEVALLQTALQNIQRKYGVISSLGRNEVIGSIDDFRISIDDIVLIREDDGVSNHEAEHRNRKLIAGLFCTVLKEKLDFWEPGECFESINEIYPPIGWTFFLEIVKVFQWVDHFIECLGAIHPETMLDCTDEILNCLWDANDHNNVTVLVRLLPLLIQPMHFQHLNSMSTCTETVEDVSSLRLEKYKVQIKKIVEILLEHLSRKKEWSDVIVTDYFTILFNALTKICHGFLLGNVIVAEFEPQQLQNQLRSTAACKLSQENLDDVHQVLCGKTENSNPEASTVAKVEAIDWILLKCYQLAYESLLLLDNRELSSLLAQPSKSSQKTKNSNSSHLRICIFIFEKTCKKAVVSCAGRSEKLASTIQLVQQRLEPLCVTLSQNVASTTEDIIDIVDNRHNRYEECIDHIIATPLLVTQSEFLDCLKRNAVLLNAKQAHNLLRQVGKNPRPMSLEKVQEIILAAFGSWNWAVQQQFQRDYLVLYNDCNLLLTKDFEEDLTMTFNKMINADVKTNTTLFLQMGRLCLQSSRQTIAQAVFQAMNSKAQGNILIQLLTSVWSTCRYRDVPTAPTMLCDVLNDVLLNYCLTDMQFQNLKTFIKKLLKAKIDPSFEVAFVESTLVTRAELVHTCILPYLDQWNPGRGCRLTLFAIQLLQMVLSSDTSDKSCRWLREFKPCIFLCYLGLIVGQCKLVHRENGQVDWIKMKSQAVATLVILIGLIGENPMAYITRMEMIWLCDKLQAVDESLAFYFMDLCEYFCIELQTSETGDALEGIFEFSCCSDTNASIAKPWFGRAVVDLGRTAKIRVLSALKMILPFSLPEEWKRIVLLLDYILRHEQLSIPLKSCLTITSQDGQILCNLASLLINTIFTCNAAGINVRYMLQCFRAIIKDRLSALEESSDINVTDLTATTAELFVRVCMLMSRLPTKPIEEGYRLLMELCQIKMKKSRPLNDDVNKVMTAAASKLQASTFQNHLLKALSQEC